MEILEEKRSEHVVVLKVTGRLDPTTAGSFEKKLMEVIAGGGRHLLLDLARLEYVSSAGLRVLLTSAKKLKATSGKIVLFSVKRPVKEVLDLSGFSTMFSVCDSLAEAMAGLS